MPPGRAAFACKRGVYHKANRDVGRRSLVGPRLIPMYRYFVNTRPNSVRVAWQKRSPTRK